MAKILSKSGDSLADAYNVVGSIAGIDDLVSREVSLVHEMGNVMFSERYVTTFRRMATGDMLQDIDFDLVITNLPGAPTRLLGLGVISDAGTRILRACASVRDHLAGNEIPIWAYDGSNFTPVDLVSTGDATGSTTFDLLHGIPAGPISVPTMMGGSLQGAGMVDSFAFRGRTTSFGAGTVFITLLLYFGFAFQEGLSSRGVPFPSW